MRRLRSWLRGCSELMAVGFDGVSAGIDLETINY